MRPEAGGICHICHMVNLALGVNVIRSSSCPAHTLCVCPPPTRCLRDREMNQKWRRASAISLNFARNTRPPTLYTSHNAVAMFTPCLHELGLIGYALSLSGAVVSRDRHKHKLLRCCLRMMRAGSYILFFIQFGDNIQTARQLRNAVNGDCFVRSICIALLSSNMVISPNKLNNVSITDRNCY